MSYRETDPTARSMRIAIFLPSWIGDVAMATPALRAVRQHYGSQAQLIGVARTYVESVLAGNQHLDDWISYQPHLRGGSRSPMTREELLAKFTANLDHGGLGPASAEGVARFADGLAGSDGALDLSSLELKD